ncbi:MAG: hypothetical protein Q4D20_10510 [Clostridia bacterium]|nr:hypothetical protein [Clostridia bacterium]
MINLKGGNSYSLFGAYPGENDIDAYISWESKGFVRDEYGNWRKGNISVLAYTNDYTLGYILFS